jgi:hypothetical protein
MNVKQSHLGWSYSLNQEEFYGVYDTKEEAIEEALDAIECDGDVQDVFYIAEAIEPKIEIDPINIIENMQDQAIQEYDYYAFDYLNRVSREDIAELYDRLNKEFNDWQEKNGYKPNFYDIRSEESYSINDYDSEKREITKQHKQTDIFQMGC